MDIDWITHSLDDWLTVSTAAHLPRRLKSREWTTWHEDARVENAGMDKSARRSRMDIAKVSDRLKMTDMKMTDQTAGHEHAEGHHYLSHCYSIAWDRL